MADERCPFCDRPKAPTPALLGPVNFDFCHRGPLGDLISEYNTRLLDDNNRKECEAKTLFRIAALEATLALMPAKQRRVARDIQIKSVSIVDAENAPPGTGFVKLGKCSGFHDDSIADGNLTRCSKSSGCGLFGCPYQPKD